MSNQNNPETQVNIFKLLTGEEIIAECEDVGNAFVCHNALEILKYPDQSGKIQMSIQKFMPYMDDPFVLQKVGYAIVGVPEAQMLAQYNQIFGNIIVPEQKIVLK